MGERRRRKTQRSQESTSSASYCLCCTKLPTFQFSLHMQIINSLEENVRAVLYVILMLFHQLLGPTSILGMSYVCWVLFSDCIKQRFIPAPLAIPESFEDFFMCF
ncbi:hypothetical protein GJAV_G00173400 [Gymnothorax javanicus]|nr:hypothetical protein GJAV_G00173400 [Gymnothorax javanicus]